MLLVLQGVHYQQSYIIQTGGHREADEGKFGHSRASQSPYSFSKGHPASHLKLVTGLK